MADTFITTVDFHGAKLIARRGNTQAETLVAMKPVVEGMGLAWESQLVKIKGHPVLSQGTTMIVMPSSGGAQEMTALPLNRLNFWLATIQPDRVPDPDTRAKVIAYQTECADALFEHFFGKVHEVISPAQCREIRTMLGQPRAALAKLTGYPVNSITLFENDKMVFPPHAQETIRRALVYSASRLRKAAKTPAPPKALAGTAKTSASPMVKLEFQVPATAAAKICAFVAKMTATNSSRGE